MAYQRYSMTLPRQRRDAVHQQLLEHPVEQPDGESEHDGQDHDHAGGLDELGPSGPGDLLQLGPNRPEKTGGLMQPERELVPRRRDVRVHWLLRLLVRAMLVATRAILPILDPLRVLPAVLRLEEVPVAALGA